MKKAKTLKKFKKYTNKVLRLKNRTALKEGKEFFLTNGKYVYSINKFKS